MNHNHARLVSEIREAIFRISDGFDELVSCSISIAVSYYINPMLVSSCYYFINDRLVFVGLNAAIWRIATLVSIDSVKIVRMMISTTMRQHLIRLVQESCIALNRSIEDELDTFDFEVIFLGL